MVRLSRRLDKLMVRRESLARRLERAEFAMVRTGRRPRGSVACCGHKGDLVQLLEEELMNVNEAIKLEKQRESQITIADAGFVSFKNLRTISLVMQTTLLEDKYKVDLLLRARGVSCAELYH